VKLFLMRHGEASFQAPSDMQRPLTERGIEQTKAVLDKNANDFNCIKTIFASPYLRAQQTAQIVSEAIGLPILTMTSITPDGNPHRVCDSLFESAQQFGDIILITHMPFVGDLSSLLVSGDLSSPDAFTTSQIVMFESEHVLPGCMSKEKTFLPY
jgi:phosphohistidine phosphatase